MPCCKGKKEPSVDKTFVRRRSQWNTYTISCCENWGNCCCCLLCFPCFMADLLHYVCNLPWGLALIFGLVLLPFHPLLLIPLRMRIRRKHNLEGNILSDLLCLLCCCWPCVICQMRDQVHHLLSRRQWALSYANEVHHLPPWMNCCVKCIRRRADRNDSTNSEETGSDLEGSNESDGSVSEEDVDEEESEPVKPKGIRIRGDTG
ncbi:hypothetical protein EG68_08246 [Paragonimus skrjabini miyazakii]|uniref:Uncharacterized protein n=1 Tax=Paragonimus skrjabini miyazakii TaxID=59628 RepID=A0A8S9YIH1_9TREM|nr:hypothetical protein EG68_08246 [Paragonimus skrjabini miyazakii]